MTYEEITAVIAETAKLLEPFEVSGYPEAETWAILTADDFFFVAEHMADRHILVVSCPVGEPTYADREKHFENLLGYSNSYELTGGAYMAYEPESGTAKLVLDIATSALTANGLATILSRMTDIARSWKTVVETAVAGDNLNDLTPDTTLIRV